MYNDVSAFLEREINYYNVVTKDETMALLVGMVQSYLKKKEGIITSTKIIQHLKEHAMIWHVFFINKLF